MLLYHIAKRSQVFFLLLTFLLFYGIVLSENKENNILRGGFYDSLLHSSLPFGLHYCRWRWSCGKWHGAASFYFRSCPVWDSSILRILSLVQGFVLRKEYKNGNCHWFCTDFSFSLFL